MASQSASVHHQTDRQPASLIVCSVWLAGVVLAGTMLTPLSAAAGTASAATVGAKGNQPRRMSGGALARTRGLSQTDRDRLRKPSQFLEQTGTPVEEETPSFTPERALASVERVERLVASGAQVADWDSLKKAAGLIPGIRLAISGLESGAMSREETLSLTQGVAELENLEGLALKGRHHTASYRPSSAQPLPAGFGNGLDGEYPRPEGTTTKINTGWILDQHVFDPESPKTYPTLLSDYKHYDEGQSDIAMGHSDHPDANSMFGWVWEVQSFYWTDTTIVADHANASYCLFVMVSSDGGFTWQLYEILYDPTSASHTTSLDMINPKLAMDITGTTGGGLSAYDRFYIA